MKPRVASGRRKAVQQPTPVHGWLCDHDSRYGDPVIINADAEALALMAWGLGQLEAVNQLLEAIANRRHGDDVSLVAGAVWHLTSQAETVIRAAHQVHIDSYID